MHWLSSFFYMEEKSEPPDKRIKKLTSIEMKFFKAAGIYTSQPQKEQRNFGTVESRTS
jgi:hypothetical protein